MWRSSSRRDGHPRERQALIEGLRNEIELLWLTGELRLEKPSVPQEIAWGLHFFGDTLFDAVPALHERLDQALAQSYPGESFEVPAFFSFGSWIGGDRDDNPFVTNQVTRGAVMEGRLASLRRYQRRLAEVGRLLSVSERGLRADAGVSSGLVERARERSEWGDDFSRGTRAKCSANTWRACRPSSTVRLSIDPPSGTCPIPPPTTALIT